MHKIIKFLIICFVFVGFVWGINVYMKFDSYNHVRVHCIFETNELGSKEGQNQWYWDYYKCGDGVRRRMMVASPRG